MTFASWWERGFHDLIPIVPPDAPLAARSNVKAESRGKVPGVKRADGTWTGLPRWTEVKPDAAWGTWGANIGLRTANYPAVDIDCDDAGIAELVEGVALRVLGDAPIRRRENSARRTLLYRTAIPMARMRLLLARGDERFLVEILGDGQQFVVEGLHPSGVPWEWNREPRVIGLTLVGPEDCGNFLNAVRTAAEAAGLTVADVSAAGATADRGVSQESLQGNLAQLQAAVALIPNNTPDRDDYLRMGISLKASLPEDPGAAFDLWWSWCQKWQPASGERNTRAQCERDWAGFVPPFAIGSGWLLDRARQYGYQTAPEEFASVTSDPPTAPKVALGRNPLDALIPEHGYLASWSDAGMADALLTALQGQVVFCPEIGEWLLWNGKCWEGGKLATAYLTQKAQTVANDRGQVARHRIKGPAGERKAEWCGSIRTRDAMIRAAAVDPRALVTLEQFDNDPWKLNTPAGVVDLRTGTLTAPDPRVLVRHMTAVAPQPMPTPKWTAFLEEMAQHDAGLLAYLQRLAGYCLTGCVNEEILVFLWGPGGNGKTVFRSTLFKIWGNYAEDAPMEAFVESRFERHSTELAKLQGARLVTASETQQGHRWDEAKIKRLTGNEPITARFLYRDYFTYLPHFKLVFAGNHKPHLTNLDDAMRRRMHLVPFIVRPQRVNDRLMDELEAEWPGILEWAIQGALAWQREGLQFPPLVASATADYFAGEDLGQQWWSERVYAQADAVLDAATAWNDWRYWCEQQNERAGTYRTFLQGLRLRAGDLVTRNRQLVAMGWQLRKGAEFR